MRRTIAGLVLVLLGAGAAATLWQAQNRAEPVTLSAAQIAPLVDRPGAAQLFVTIQNPGPADVLLAAQSPEAGTAEIAAGTGPLILPEGSTPSLAADGAHMLLTEIEGPLDEGRLIPITLTFQRSGPVSTNARVGIPSDPHARHMAMRGVRPEGPAPTLSLEVTPLGDGRWSVAAETQNFTFAEPVAEPEHVAGEGHGHLYLNGLKLQRVYARETVIGALPPGTHRLSLSLNTNTHRAYLGADGPVAATADITVE